MPPYGFPSRACAVNVTPFLGSSMAGRRRRSRSLTASSAPHSLVLPQIGDSLIWRRGGVANSSRSELRRERRNTRLFSWGRNALSGSAEISNFCGPDSRAGGGETDEAGTLKERQGRD